MPAGSGPPDQAGESEPWIELFNTGSQPARLDGCYLGDDFSRPLAWAFPANTVIPPHSYLLVRADGEPGESRPDELHASFRLEPGHGRVLLSRWQYAEPAVLDYIEYAALDSALSQGCASDGEPLDREALAWPTPGLPNLRGEIPVITSFAIEPDGTVTLRWSSRPNRSYAIQTKSSLNDPAWDSLAQVLADAYMFSYADPPDPLDRARFYRVVLLP
jgi:hypothetical protein